MPRREDPAWLKCELCEREVPPGMVTLHHLTPKQKGGKAEDRVPVCRPCHKQVHAVFGNADLARSFASVQTLREAPQLQAFLRWIRKQKPERNFRADLAADHPTRRRRRNR
jgi:hypothetical protein